MLKILFLCTGNSCRSQMAEALGRKLKSSDEYKFFSAGIVAHGLNPNALKVIDELGIDMRTHSSQTLEELDVEIGLENLDYVFTVCANAHETCPIFPGEAKVFHVGFDDPPSETKEMTNEEEILVVYRRVRDEIKEFINSLESYINR